MNKSIDSTGDKGDDLRQTGDEYKETVRVDMGTESTDGKNPVEVFLKDEEVKEALRQIGINPEDTSVVTIYGPTLFDIQAVGETQAIALAGLLNTFRSRFGPYTDAELGGYWENESSEGVQFL